MGLASFCLGVAFVLALVATLSVPIIQSIVLVEIRIPHGFPTLDARATDVVRLGLWGFCQNRANVENPDLVAYDCSEADQCYTSDPAVARALHVNNPSDIVSPVLSTAAFMQPVGCFVMLLAFLASICMFSNNQYNVGSITAWP
ncbi:hypothetical protein C8T65DRAFT_160902 [Cerioporus squamosus]|nr:hypothetical protein C8T65DRAFT_160902 [Cerioporus squamosus]